MSYLPAPPWAPGYNPLVGPGDDTGIVLGVRRLDGAHQEIVAAETAYLVLQGGLELGTDSVGASLVRASVFEDPWCLHVPAGTQVTLRGQAELLVASVDNTLKFEARLIGPERVRHEARGAGLWEDTALRQVRTIFDDDTGPPESALVLGEVVNLPGRWSSYPPHGHPQPELYHYRFDHPAGYGHAELGEQVYKVRSGDTTKIVAGQTHAQCAAPGYRMWYAWVIRHLPGQRYRQPTFDPAHRWLLEPR